ncbi:tRNA (adenosine(37)-N6)-threonylcarbamoyltransferase complex dimerization subunit type 1 TsaB [Sphingomonas sp.]|uniref:tRNA (adenosine(37)-N6)-threonylcarbamoyltransferase complex dimerization subunit type 1 TsaB n=1 Tax=Sphingomonas sp. TaxID=28214 RepID=UPI002DBC7E9C|nr:tRNA (adenosine(37)-N6)-threonylcarbamoyltransferase complex dimerization subunit type 1 TsaB [Sphingomonas sp.]HEU4969454.1 tRNA (adenosine(37)-N6)-threonylcarbamoyltransferase complex dimerization subunit type 1 TsaB [Sphingomonas sp.]
MRRLAIETATGTCSVALFEDRRLIGHVHELVGRGHAERLIPMIAELPDSGRADAILVDCGPGSFTGVRVGLAAARALALAWHAGIAGYSSLALIAATAFAEPDASETLTVAIIGGHGEYFVQRFEREGVRPITPLASLKPDAAALLCGTDPVAGSGAEAMRAAGASGPALAIEADARNTALMPPSLAALPPSPIYGRAPDARLPG